MIRARFKWTGVPKLGSGIELGLHKAAEFLLEECSHVVPHDTGTLERSGNTDVGGNMATVYYDTPYAVTTHEHPEWNFQGGREGKYLERTFNRHRRKAQEIIAETIKNHSLGG